MRALTIKTAVFLSLLFVPFVAHASDVTVSGTTTFASLDGSADDADHTVNGVFTVNGNLTVNGTINCNDDGAGANGGCPMQFLVSGNVDLNAGSQIFAENRTKAGNGGNISFLAGGNVMLHGATASLAGALISSAKTNGGNPAHGGDITINAGGTFVQELGSIVSSAANDANAGAISITSSGQATVGGFILAGPSRAIAANPYTDAVMSGGGGHVVGGAITIISLSHSEPAVLVNSIAIIASQGSDGGGNTVDVEGCNVQVNGLVAAVTHKSNNARVVVRSGTTLTVDGSNLDGSGFVHLGKLRADSYGESASTNRVDVYAAKDITLLGPGSAATIYLVSANPGDKGDAGTITVISTGGKVTAIGKAFAATGLNKDQDGGTISVSAKNDVTLNGASVIAAGGTSGAMRAGGHIAVRSFSGALNWQSGTGDVRPVGSTAGVPAAQQGTIALTYCTTLSTSGTSFPTNGSSVGTFPTTVQTCSPGAPSLPGGETLPTCNTPPTANNATATTNEDNSVTITMTGSDADGDSLTFSIVTPPAHGSLSAIFNPTPTSAQVTYTPNANYNGSDSFTFQADDGKGGTSTGTVTITINPVNDPPTFNLGANPVSSNEDAGLQTIANYASSISAGPTADESSQTVTFTVTNDNNALFSVQPAIASNGTLTYTSAPDANGSANITVVAHDSGGTANGGNDTSTTHNFNIVVNAVNDAPSFTKGPDQTVLEDSGAHSVSGWATGISAGPADESSQTVTFNVSNNNNALFSVQPAVASNGTLTYTGAPNANGSATVTVVAHDDGGTANGGVDNSAPQTFTIAVGAVNDAPSFTKGADATVLEDSGAYSQSGWATGISAGPADESGQIVHFNVTNNTNAALFSVQPAVANNGTLTFTPAADANGSATITINAQDDGGTANGGVDTSASQTFVINVTAVNDAPSFTKGANQTSFEDGGPQTVAGWATAISAGPADESSQTVTFNVSNDNNALFSVQPVVASNGTLTYTAASNATGVATVTVAAHDDGGTANGGADTSANQTFTITITAVNDPPSFTKGADQTVLEDSGAHTVTNWATAISAGPADESSQTVTFTVTNDNNALFSAQPAVASDGTLTFTSAPNANGTATVTVTAHDDGGTAGGGSDTSAPQTFTITVTAVNDAPSFTKGGDQSSLEDGGAQTVPNWATGISAGPANESSQVVNFIVSNDNNALFSSQPAVASNGTLTYTAAPNANGVATVTVAIHDDGGTANGGVDTSASQTFTITVTAVNDAPSFTKGADQTVLEDSGAHTVAPWATGISAGPANESSQTVSFTTTNDNNALFSSQPAVDASGNLTFTTAPDANGTATVTVTAHDSGGTANGGVDSSAPQTFVINVTAVNDAPSFTKGPDESASSDAGPQSYANWATAISAGPANESAQTVSFLVNNDNNAAFAAQPAVSSTGTLTFTPAVSAPTTTVHVTVAAHDNGGTANGGVDTSATQTFNINVTHANQPPVANGDSYDAVGNTELVVGTPATQPASLVVASGSVLANDTDSDGDTLTATLGTASAGATVTVNPNGSFSYLPPAGFTGNDTFTYVVNDGHSHTATATVTIHVTKRILYVKNDGGGSTGRVDSPYSLLLNAQSAAGVNDTVYVFAGDGTTSNQSTGFTLSHNGERLIGEGVALNASGTYNTVVNPTLRVAGSRPKIGNITGGNVVTLTGASSLEVSGVEIPSSTLNGVSISNATDVVMNGNRIASTTNSGVKGTGVTNFSFTNNTVDTSGSTVDDSNVAFNTASSGTEVNLTGTVTITGNTLTNPLYQGVDIQNFGGTISNLNVSNNTITSPTSTTTSKGTGIRIGAIGSASAVASITRGTINNNVISNFPSNAGIQLAGGNGNVAGPAGTYGVAGNSSNVITIDGNTIHGLSSAVRMGTNAIVVSVNGNGQGNFDVSNNGTASSPITNMVGNALSVSAFGLANVTATINNNVVVANNSVASSGIAVGIDKTFAATDNGSMTVTINNNQVSATDGNGIIAVARNSSTSLTAKIQNNTVAAPLSGSRPGIRVDSGTSTGNTSVCLNISGNTSAGSGGVEGIGLRKQGTVSTLNGFGVNGMAATSSPGVEAYVNGLNPAGGGTLLLSATSGFTGCSNP
jgi:hypothetical protein